MPSDIVFSMAGLILIGICVVILFLEIMYIVIRHYKKQK